jgi:molybdopterin/thiamine biosynthesis adenylyltransferase
MSKHDRQSFLGEASEQIIKATTVGLVGLGGGGSHVVQQLAHIGVERYVLVDPDVIEESNLNRLVGGTSLDVAAKASKVAIAERVIRGVIPDPKIDPHQCNWQQAIAALKGCDVIIAGVDSVIAKDELDKFCRRYLIPLIDMGMDVHRVGGRYLIAGQVIMTTPGAPCLRCMGIVTDDLLAKEANRYGAAGSKPQVVWPNGVLASTAVALFMQLICPWLDKGASSAYLEYDGNQHTLTPSKSFALIHQQPCPHNFPEETGDPLFDIRAPATQPTPNADVVKVEAPVSASLEAGASLSLWMSKMWRRLRNG